ncbi:radical SAM protein [Archaeoglobales archaeon]|nr:MAG: radical SAM protein [Archaeoglobales archaeon]
MIEREAGSFYTYLPEGCQICGEGGKLVLFLTGECVHSCFYCPISEERRSKDVIFANERPVKSERDIIEEIELMDADGASITGGEPLSKPARLIKYLKLLKEFDLHIHLYTSIPASWKTIEKLSPYLDEIRFHPVNLENPEKFIDAIRYSKEMGMDAGFEIPALYFRPDIVEIANNLDCFLNLNELEFSQTNYENLVKRGYEVDDFYGAIGSREIAERYATSVEKFHYCTARFKDSVQLRRRLLRMAYNHPEFYTITEDGTIMCGLIEGGREKIQKAIEFLDMVGGDYRFIQNAEVSAIETSVETVRKWRDRFKVDALQVSIIERYPTYKRIIVEVEPL